MVDDTKDTWDGRPEAKTKVYVLIPELQTVGKSPVASARR